MDRFEEVKMRIKEGIDLAAWVENFLPLRVRGRNRVGLCPFHQEKTPSFTVFTDTQHYKCFGCGKAGDIFSFVMEREGLDFRQALEMLAERAGISTDGLFKKERGQARAGARDRQDVPGTLGRVREYFMRELQSPAGQVAREYLENRGLLQAVEGFGLGYHPVGGRLREFARKEGLDRKVLVAAGLLSRDGQRERFAGRLVFPIEDERGRVVGFGGRVLATAGGEPGEPGEPGEEAGPKYLNSSESPFFNKRRLLFGLRRAKLSGVRKLIVMEGYTDVLAAHLAGLTGAVATLGTALTAEHGRLLERYATEGVVLLFDGDRAGRQAAERAFRELLQTQLPVRIALLEEGQDPADMLSTAAGRVRLEAILDGAEDSLDVWFRLLRARLDLTLDVHVERAAGDCAEILRSLQDPVRQAALQSRMAAHLGLPEAVFRQTVRRAAGSTLRRGPEKPSKRAAEGGRAEAEGRMGGLAEDEGRMGGLAEADLDLLACLLAAPELESELPSELSSDDFCLTGIRDLILFVREGLAVGYGARDALVRYLFSKGAERQELVELLSRCLDRSPHIKNPKSTLALLLKDRRTHLARHRARQTRFLLQQARSEGNTTLEEKLRRDYFQQLRHRDADQT